MNMKQRWVATLVAAVGAVTLVACGSTSKGGTDATVQVQVELAHTGERSQVSYLSAQIAPSAGGLASQFDACYFPN